MLSSFAQLRQQLHQSGPRSAVVAAAQDEHTLQAVLAARRDGLIHPILVGPPDQLRPLLDRLGASVPDEDLVPAGTEAECAARAVALVRQGRGSLLIKGHLSTGALLGAVVDRAGGIRGDGLLSHVAILEVPAYHKLLYITDGGLVVAPGLEEKRAILRNALSLCRFLGYERPKAAALCAAETVSPRMPETGDAAALREEGSGETSAPAWWRAPSLWIWPPVLRRPASRATAARWRGTRTSFSSPPSPPAICWARPSMGWPAGRWPVWCWAPRCPSPSTPGGLPGRRNITPSSSAPPCPGGDPAKKEAFLMPERLLILNPGSTSTKAAVYDGTRPLFSRSIPHSNQDLAPFPTLNDQLDYRVALVRGLLAQERVDLSTLTAVVGRGGILPNIVAGGYQVNDALVDCLLHYPVFEHASNLGGVMALAFARPLGIPAYIYDAVTSDELLPEARITGFKGVTRTSFCHVLNARATAHKYAESRGLAYKDMNLVVAHLGGGISISAHSHGRIIDSVSDDAGPFSPDRSGSTNTLYVVDLCYSGKYTKAEMLKKLRGEGGMSALLGTHDCREIERRIQAGDERAALVYKAQALQIAKGVGTLLGCFTELIDAVILTGGLAYSKMLTDMVIGYLHNLARVVVIPGENEMEALALGGLRLLRGEEPVHTFAPACDLSVIP